jgi:hypothetical protein
LVTLLILAVLALIGFVNRLIDVTYRSDLTSVYLVSNNDDLTSKLVSQSRYMSDGEAPFFGGVIKNEALSAMPELKKKDLAPGERGKSIVWVRGLRPTRLEWDTGGLGTSTFVYGHPCPETEIHFTKVPDSSVGTAQSLYFMRDPIDMPRR